MRGNAYAHPRAPKIGFRQEDARWIVGSSATTTTEVIMNRPTQPLIKAAASGATALGLVLLSTAGAAAMRPVPDGTGTGPAAPATEPPRPVVDASVTLLQWTLFTVIVLAALVIGAAVMYVVQRRHAAAPAGAHETTTRDQRAGRRRERRAAG